MILRAMISASEIVVVEVRTFGVTLSVGLVRTVEPKDVHLPSKKTPLSAKKWGSPAVGRSQAGTAGTHDRCAT